MSIGFSGIYIIKNTINGHVYVGQSHNVAKRISEHKTRLNKNETVINSEKFQNDLTDTSLDDNLNAMEQINV
jgi:predicted GIY-YIG superfamily endonuclease